MFFPAGEGKSARQVAPVKDFLSTLDQQDFRVIAAVFVLLLGYASYRGASRALGSWARRGAMGAIMEQRVRTLLRIFASSVTVLLAVQQAGAFEHAWALLSALVTTVAVGFFAIWSVLSNMVCALLISLFRPFRVGDWVEVIEGPAPHPSGFLVDMNLFFVSLADRPAAEVEGGQPACFVRIPNTLFFQKIVRCRSAEPGADESKQFFD